MKKVTIELFNISELSREAKSIAIEQHRDFLLSVFNPDDYIECGGLNYDEYKKGLSNEEVINNIKINEYLFFPNGELTNSVLYCGEHPEAGKHILNLFDNEYNIF